MPSNTPPDSDPGICRMSVGRFRFVIVPREPLILPSFKGSTLRGGFGCAFKRVICALRKEDCSDCILKEKCIYSYVFETPPPSDTKIMKKYRTAPHPFIIEPPPEKRMGYKPGDEITFGLTLIGRAVSYLPYFIYAFDEMGKLGIGRGKGKFVLKDVTHEGQVIYDSGSRALNAFKPAPLDIRFGETGQHTKTVLLNFSTPTRISYDGHLILDLEFHILIRSLLRRLALLFYFHCNGDPSAWEFRGIIEMAQKIKVKERHLRWYDWERYSARQDTRMKMGGFVGSISFEGDMAPFVPLLKAGEILHVGKGTGFGLGKYEIVQQ
ncbi:MAG: CRISPR system precrRNA processing endoribonuclease RAMP protein Cas6 [Nitrospirota bacterium]